MDGNPCKIYQESEESRSREVSYYSKDFSSLLRDISRKKYEQNKNWSTQHKFYQKQI